MRSTASAAVAAAMVVGIAVAAGHSAAPRPSYDYGLTSNPWWAAQQRRTAPRPADHVIPAALDAEPPNRN